MNGFLLGDGGKAIASLGLTWLGQSSALLALGLIAGRLLRRSGPAVQSAAYRTTLAAVLICPAASTLLAGLGFDGLAIRLPAASTAATLAPVPTPLAIREVPAVAIPRALIPDRPMERPIAKAIAAMPASSADEPTTPSPAPKARWSRAEWVAASASAGLWVWALGVLLMGLRLAVGFRAMVRLRGSAIPAGPVAEALCRDLASRMSLTSPEVLTAPFLHSPCVAGLRRPAILLPDEPGVDLRDAFVHELAHLARRDVWWNLLRQVANSVLWFQPLLWVLSRRLEVTAEEVCDDYVVQFGADRASYAGLLLELAGRSLPPAPSMALGMVSLRSLLARRVVRILDSSRSISTKAGSRAIAFILVAGLAGTMLAGLLGAGGAPRQAFAQAPSKPSPGRGQVVGPDGQPVAGASVIVTIVRDAPPDGVGTDPFAHRRHEHKILVADAEGHFDRPAEVPGLSVIAKATGFGPGYLDRDGIIKLTEGDLPIRGRLVDLEGRPVAGASLHIVQLFTLPDSKARRDASGRPGPYQFPFDKSLGLGDESALPGGVVTDRDGRFRIEGLGVDALASLKISGPTIALKKVNVMTRDMPRVTRDDSRQSGSMGFEDLGIYGADCTIVVQPTRPIEGVVRDLESNRPIPGAIVTAAQVGGSNLNLEGQITARTDAEGRYRLLGLPQGNGHKLSVYPPLDRPYFITRFLPVPARPGLDPVPFDIALKAGTWITGRVTNAKTSAPVMASVDYFPFLDNPRAGDYPNFRGEVSSSLEVTSRYRTDGAGRYRVVGLPGRGVVTARSDDRAFRTGAGSESIAGKDKNGQLPTYNHIYTHLYQGIREMDVPPGRDSASCDLPLDPGGSVVLKFEDESGRPLEQVVAYGRFPNGADDGDHNIYEGTSARVGGLETGRPRTVVLKQLDRDLGLVLELPADGPRDGRDVVVRLRPNAKVAGRILAEKPLPPRAGVQVWTIQAGTTDGFLEEIPVASATLEPDGRFQIAGLPPGGTYAVRAVADFQYGFRDGMPEGFKPFEVAVDFKPNPGEVVDLGTFDARLGKRVAIAAKADEPKRPEKTASVPIRGRILDLEGRPLAGVSVTTGHYRKSKSADLTPWLEGAKQGKPPWTMNDLADWNESVPGPAPHQATTDRDGRFRLEGLGAEWAVELKLQGDAIAQTTLDVATRPMEPILARGFPSQVGSGARTIYGAEFTYTAAPGRPVEGVVKDAKTGVPLAGAEVRSYRFSGSDFVGTMTIRVKADAQGRFRLVGMPKGKGNELIIVPTDEQPYLMQEVKILDPPGGGPVSVEVALPRGIWIEGTLTEQATGKPVAGAWLNYSPFLGNQFALANPVFDRDGNTDGTGFQDRYLSKPDGTFRLVGLPGRAIVGANVHGKTYVQGHGSEAIADIDKNGHFPTYNNPVRPSKIWPTTMKEINPPADAETVRLDLQVRTGPSVRLKIVDASGQDVVGTSTRGRSGRDSWDKENLATAEGAATNLMPGEERSVLILHEGRKIGKAVRVHEGDDAKGPIVVTLEPLATIAGRVLDPEGHPAKGATVRPDVLPGGDFSLSLTQVATDDRGMFRVLDVPAGCDYSLAFDNNTVAVKDRNFVFIEKVVVKPGESTDVGEVRFKKN